MEPTKELLDDLFRERVLRARQMSPEEKLLAGPRLFDEECRRMMDDIRRQYPDTEEARVKAMMIERMEEIRRQEELESGLYKPFPASKEP